jgi:hypothetical protein
LVLRNGHGAAALAVDDRERLAPVSLAREEPVAEFVVDARAAVAFLFQPVGDAAFGVNGREAVDVDLTETPSPT